MSTLVEIWEGSEVIFGHTGIGRHDIRVVVNRRKSCGPDVPAVCGWTGACYGLDNHADDGGFQFS